MGVERQIHETLLAYFSGDKGKVEAWMMACNPQLGGHSPEELIFQGRAEELLQFIGRKAA